MASSLQASLPIHLSTAIVVLDQYLCLQYLNPAAEALLAISLPKYQGQKVDRFISPESLSPEELKQTLASEQPFIRRETTLHLNSLQSVTADYSVTPFKESGKEPGKESEQSLLLIELRPLDRLLRISHENKQLSNLESSKNLVRGLAHEIKNPLGGLRGAAQLLERQLHEPTLKDYTQIIIAEADRLGKLVDQLLGPRSKPQMETTNIHAVLERVYALSNAEAAGLIDFHRDYDPSLPSLRADKAQLIQALLNIVKNAMQALSGQNNAMITLRSRCQRQFTINKKIHKLLIRIDICDNGPGIPEHLLDSLFLPTITGSANGSGLGLSISQAIITQHHGLLACKSEPGNTQFTIYLPLEDTACHS